MIIFENPGEIDLRSITTFGVSVKEGDNPIGFFGTGMKYAIALLLRTGHKVTVQAGARHVRFDTQKDAVRGQDFEFITMRVDGGEPQQLGFTTQLGKQWELWMAYRELACNCKDEKGTGRFDRQMPAPEAAKPDNWQQYAQDGENAQQCIERHRKEQDALLTLLANARRPYSDNEEMKL